MKLRFISGKKTLELTICQRDFGLLRGPPKFVPGGVEFIDLLGVFEDFDVEAGQPRQSEVRRSHSLFTGVTRHVLYTVERDLDLLEADYSVSFSDTSERHSGGGYHGFRVWGMSAGFDLRPKGFCTLEVLDVAPDNSGRTAALLDLRVLGEIETDDRGTLRVHHRRAKVSLHEILGQLMEFSESVAPNDVVIQNRW